MRTEPGSLLLVEDNPVTRDLLARVLRDKGHAVVVCGDGRQALELAAASRFDLVLLDVGVPGADGFEVLRSLRLSHPAVALPVVMATALGQSEAIVRALEMGANDYVTKPYDLPVLLARVGAQLSAKRLVEQKAQLERTLAERNAELETANRQLSEANRRMRASLKAAARIQEALLPPRTMTILGLRLAWSFRPCEDLAGDTLNAFALDDDHVVLYLLDVSGHGVPAALLSVHLSLILSPRDPSSSLVRTGGASAGSPVPPAEVVGALNRRFAWDTTQRYFTLFYGVLNLSSGEFHYACAGHPGPALVSGASGCRLLPPSGPPVGVWDVKYEGHVLPLEPGDRLYLYSDGVTEAADPGGRMYGEERLADLLVRHQGATLEDSLAALIADVEAWCGGPAGDDVSVLAAEFTRVAQRSTNAAGQLTTG
jgi:sigma-B regulation protein RsbU (phosphoserine phosphatase)